MENQIKVKVVGHTENTLTFYPKASTGSIRDGVAFENGNTGGWVIAYSDFLKMVELAKQHHAQQSVQPTAFGVGKRKHPARAIKQIRALLVKHGGG